MCNRIEKPESANEDRPKIAQGGREIANFFFLKAIVLEKSVFCPLFRLAPRQRFSLGLLHASGKLLATMSACFMPLEL